MVQRINKTALIVVSLSVEGELFIKQLAKDRSVSVSACVRELVEAALDAQGVKHPTLGKRCAPIRRNKELRHAYLRRYLAGEASHALALELGVTIESFHTIMQSARRDEGGAINTLVSERNAETMSKVLQDPFFPMSARTREIAEAFVLYRNQQVTAEAMGVSRQRVDQVVFALTRHHRASRRGKQSIEATL